MTRRAERRAAVRRWAAIQAVGWGIGAAGFVMAPAPWGVAILAVAIGAALLLGHRHMVAAPGVAILTYHSVSPAPGWLPWSRDIAVHPQTFAGHLATLARMGARVMATRELVARRAAGVPVPPRAVVLHFDDGYLDNHRFAAPLLREYGVTATFFPSLDFIEPGNMVRHDGDVAGYMRWSELSELAAAGFEVEPHGVNHARVPVSDRAVGVLDAGNWRQHAWMQWAATPGPKHDWHRAATPEAVPLGSPIPQSGLALAVRAWRDGARESEGDLADRITRDLTACRAAFEAQLGITPRLFCWPENKTCPEARAIARSLGYRATTGGAGRNAAGEPADVLSRVHVDDRALGFRWGPAEALYLRATVRAMQGQLYWYLLLAPMHALRRAVFALRVRLGSDFA